MTGLSPNQRALRSRKWVGESGTPIICPFKRTPFPRESRSRDGRRRSGRALERAVQQIHQLGVARPAEGLAQGPRRFEHAVVRLEVDGFQQGGAVGGRGGLRFQMELIGLSVARVLPEANGRELEELLREPW